MAELVSRYRKKPVVIEAAGPVTEDNLDDVVAWVQGHDHEATGVTVGTDGSGLAISTLEGEMLASFGDYVIRGVQGEFYPCKPDIFEATYESAGEEGDQLATSALAPAEALLAEIVADPDAYVARIRAARR